MTDTRTNEELTETTASGLRWVTLARIATELLLVASMVILARLIPPGAFGMFAVAVIVQELAVNVPSEGVGSALVQRRSITRAHKQAGLAFNLLLGLGLALVTLALAVVVVEPLFGTGTAQLVALTTPWFLMGAIVAVPLATLRRNLDFRRTSLLQLVQSGVRSIASVIFAVSFGFEGGALVLGGLAGMFAMLVTALVFAPIPFPRWRTAPLRELLSYGGPASIASIAWVGFRNGDYAIIGAKLGTVSAGYYWRGFQLAVEYQAKISSMMSQMAFPVLARTVGPEEMFALRRRMVRLLTVVVFPPLACLVIVAPVLIPWLFGPDWEPAVLPTQILAGAGAATVVIDAVGTVLMASGRSRAMLGYGVAHFFVYVVAVLIAASYGLTAVCCAAVGVHLVFTAVAYQVLLRSPGRHVFRFIWDDMSAAVTGCAVLGATAWPTYALLMNAGAPSVIVLGAVTVVAAIAYLGTLAIWFPADARDLQSLIRRVVPTGRIHAAVRRFVPVTAGRSS